VHAWAGCPAVGCECSALYLIPLRSLGSSLTGWQEQTSQQAG
jgi:hypothetical protein